MRQKIIDEIFAYLLDHYWDSLEDERHMLELHLHACKEQLKKGDESRKSHDDLLTRVFIALGEASMCWANIEQAGIFQSEEAVRIGMQLVRDIEQGGQHG